MLVDFRVKNFRSFRDEQRLQMTAGSNKELEQSTFPVAAIDDVRLLRTAVIYGANASGKSNLIKAMSLMRRLVLRSSELPEARLFAPEETWLDDVIPFRLDREAQKEPTTFEINFVQEGVRYQYGFAVNRERVVREFLVAYTGKSRQRWFDRHPSQPIEEGWSWSDHLKGEKKRIASLTRPDALFLSVAAQFNHQQLSPVYGWFKDRLRVIDNATGISEASDTTVRLVNENEDYRTAVTDALRAADLGIDGFEIDMAGGQPRQMKRPDGTVIRIPRRQPVVRTFHSVCGSNERVVFDLRRDESLGTRRFFGLVGPWLHALKSSEVVLTDELDASMHPVLTRFLVNLFNDPKVNPNNAQAIVTTHDTTLLDNSVFRRDQVWFTEKDEGGASHLYSLQDYHPRKDEALQKGYLAGRYGAIPFLGEFSFDGK